MGTINILKEEFKYNPKCNGWERVIKRNSLFACKTFLNKLKFKRAIKSFKCGICRKEKPKYTRYIGGNYSYERVCCDCSIEWVENSLKELEKMKKIILKNKSDFELNKDKWKKEMIIGSLS